MTEDEKEKLMALHRDVHALLADALGPLLTRDNKKGVVAMRVFYAIAQDDGITMGQAGLTCEGREDDAITLIRTIPMVLRDPDGNREVGVKAFPEKQ